MTNPNIKDLFRVTYRRRLAAILIAFIVYVGMATAVPEAAAQRKHSKKKASSATIDRTSTLSRSEKKDQDPATDEGGKLLLSSQSSRLPVAIVNLAEPDYLSGEASVTVNPKQPTVIRLGLAQNAVSIVEFPASDGIYYIHEGNPKLASVFQSPTKESDRSITIYPGEVFIPQRESGGVPSPSAAITLQMRSGLVLILELVPVSDLRKNAHRCVITYDRNEVISARRLAGLAYDLGEEVKPGPTALTAGTKASSKLFGVSSAPPPNKDPEDAVMTSANREPLSGIASLEVSKDREKTAKGIRMRRTVRSAEDVKKAANKALAETIKNPQKGLGPWSASGSGLSIAMSRVIDVDADRKLVVIAVRNSTASNLKLVPESPELQIQTIDGEGNPLQTERLGSIFVESTSFEGNVIAGSTVFYALVYEAPTIGTNQRVSVLVAHRDAADAPVAAVVSSLIGLGEKNEKER